MSDCTKIPYATLPLAAYKLQRIRARTLARGKAKAPIAVYPCPHSGHGWHLTSKRVSKRWASLQPSL